MNYRRHIKTNKILDEILFGEESRNNRINMDISQNVWQSWRLRHRKRKMGIAQKIAICEMFGYDYSINWKKSID